jgi:hypothetical protein
VRRYGWSYIISKTRFVGVDSFTGYSWVIGIGWVVCNDYYY